MLSVPNNGGSSFVLSSHLDLGSGGDPCSLRIYLLLLSQFAILTGSD